jgi:hypothetical protein
MKRGERMASSMLADMFRTYDEPFDGFSLTMFDGTKVITRQSPMACHRNEHDEQGNADEGN